MRLFVSNAMQRRLLDYSESHRSSVNEALHYIGIPSIIVGAGTLLGAVPLATIAGFTVTLAEVVAFAIVIFYVLSARVLGVITSVILLGLVALGRALPVVAGLAVFLVGWALQLLGHAVYEKRSPAFLQNLLHLLVGPAWLVERALRRGKFSPAS